MLRQFGEPVEKRLGRQSFDQYALVPGAFSRDDLDRAPRYSQIRGQQPDERFVRRVVDWWLIETHQQSPVSYLVDLGAARTRNHPYRHHDAIAGGAKRQGVCASAFWLLRPSLRRHGLERRDGAWYG